MNKQDRILFMAQLPPPYHGQSMISGTVHDIFRDTAKSEVVHLWKGGAKSATDVGKRSLSKYVEFAHMVLILIGYLFSLKRFDVAYMGVAPWAHTITRDAILMFLSKLLAKRVWVHIHGEGLDKFTKPSTLKEKLISKAFKGVELISLTKADFSKAKNSAHFSKVHLLPNFAIDPGKPKFQTRKTLHLGTIGNLDPRKGVFDFVETVHQLKQNGVRVKATIMGGPTAQLSVEAMKTHVMDKGLEKEITVTGRVTDEEKHAVLANIDIFLYPSRHDLAPLSLIEAISHGCVPIVFATGGIPEIVSPYFAKNVMPVEMDRHMFAKAAADIIAAYRKDPKSLKADAKHIRAHFLEMYSEEKFRTNVLNMLSNVSGEIPIEAPVMNKTSKRVAS